MRVEHRRVALLAAMAVSSTCLSRWVDGQPAASAPAASRPAAESRAVNPHWSKTGCHYCHQMSNGRPMPIKLDEIDALCWKCHDGKRADREVHPVGRLFTGQQVVKPEGWPAPGGKLGCVTCHDILFACLHPVPRPARNPDFLRPVSGQGPLAFCAACHVGAFQPGQGRLDIHLMLNSQGKPIPERCHYCHQDSLKLDLPPVRTGHPQLRGNGVSLCIACHQQHVDFFDPGHIGHIVPEPMKATMLTMEPVLWPSSEKNPQSSPVKPPLTRLPLENGDRIMCATCHNPHEQGTFPAWSVLSDGAMPPGREPHDLRFRGLKKDLCYACHD